MADIHDVVISEVTTLSQPIVSPTPDKVFIVGSAPTWQLAAAKQTINELESIRNDITAVTEFGSETDGYTIPQALADMFAQGEEGETPEIIVCNVFDPANNDFSAAVTDEVVNFASSSVLAKALANGQKGIKKLTTSSVVVTNSAATKTYVEITDYTVVYDASDTDEVHIYRVKKLLTGTSVGVTNGSANVTGVGTNFDGDLAVGDTVEFASQAGTQYTVLTLTSDTAMILSANYTGTTAAATTANRYGIPNGDVKVDYRYFVPAYVTNTLLIGGVGLDGKRTGLQKAKDVFSLFKFLPTYLGVPSATLTKPDATVVKLGSQAYTVQSELETIAAFLDCEAAIDCEQATDMDTVVTNRATAGSNLYGASKSAVGLATGGWFTGNDGKLHPPSPFWLGGRVAQNKKHHLGWSMDNVPLRRILGSEITLDTSYSSTSDLNILTGAQGLHSMSTDGSFHWWGVHNMGYPTTKDLLTFQACWGVAQDLYKSLKRAARKYFGPPITQSLIDTILQDVNAYIDSKIPDILVNGSKCIYNPAENPAAQLELGELVFYLDFAPNPSLKLLRFRARVNSALLANIVPSSAQAA